MDIECLEHFQKIAETKSISKAADNSHISQPALSQQMKKLENSLGQELFVRSNKGVQLTSAGELVLKYADNIIRTYDKMLTGLKKEQEKEIKIEADVTIATYCLPCVLMRIKSEFPTHNYNLISGSSDQIEEDLLNDICEIGFITRNSQKEGLVSQKITEEEVVLISPKEHDVKERIDLEEILDFSLIILREKCVIKEKLNMALNDIGYSLDELNIKARVERTEAIKTLVKNGYGLGLVSYNAVKEEYADNKIQISRVKDYNLNYDIFMVSKRFENLSTETREFIESFKNMKDYICP
ncbi:MAG: LysR family transcriptional regulator [Halanaerobacter sp.]